MRKELTPPVGDSAFWDKRHLTEDPPETRTEAQRDRDRVLYSSALQRLGGITQVSPPESGWLAIIQEGQRRVIRTLFKSYREGVKKEQYRLFPPGYVERLEAAETDPARVRAVIDLIAGLTEAAAIQIYQRLCGHTTGSLLGAGGQLP